MGVRESVLLAFSLAHTCKMPDTKILLKYFIVVVASDGGWFGWFASIESDSLLPCTLFLSDCCAANSLDNNIFFHWPK